MTEPPIVLANNVQNTLPQKRSQEEDRIQPPSSDTPRAPRPSKAPAREKKETLKKRELAGNHGGSAQNKSKAVPNPSPMRYNVPCPKPTDFEGPRDPVFLSHEPEPFFTPDGTTELKKPIDQLERLGCSH